MSDPFGKYRNCMWTAEISFDQYRRISRDDNAGLLEDDYSTFHAVYDGRRERLHRGMPVMAFFSDGSGPVLGRIRSAHPENPLSYVWIEDCIDATPDNPKGILSFKREGIFPVSGWHFTV